MNLRMNHRVVMGVLFVLSLIGMFAGYVITHPSVFGLYDVSSQYGYFTLITRFGIGFPLYSGIVLLPPILFFILALPYPYFRVWWKWTVPYALFAIWFISTVPPLGGGSLTPSRARVTELFTQGLAILTLLIVAFVFVRDYFRTRKRKHSRS